MPRDNLKHLVLKDEAIQAVEANRYHIYGASSIDEGLSVLPGIPAGEPGSERWHSRPRSSARPRGETTTADWTKSRLDPIASGEQQAPDGARAGRPTVARQGMSLSMLIALLSRVQRIRRASPSINVS